MKLIFRYMRRCGRWVLLAVFLKLLAAIAELTLPRILEHLIDRVVPAGMPGPVVGWGLLMFAAAILCRQLNVAANRRAVDTAHKVSIRVRQDLFQKTIGLSGSQFDAFGLPSLISRMTSDSYNVQSAVQHSQTLCVRAPMLLLGGVLVAMTMDWHLTMVLVVLLPFLIAVVLAVSAKGIPIYAKVQDRLDSVVRIMRENITGIRVVKALSKEECEKRRFAAASEAMAKQDITAATVMAAPGPFLQLCLNTALAVIVILGARRVNAGLAEPGVLLAFLTYVNMIAMGVMGLSRIFMTMSKASASADRIDAVLQTEPDQRVLSEAEGAKPSGEGFIRFEHVHFSYGGRASGPETEDFAGGAHEKALEDISFTVQKGGSLGIIGPTGCGKTTIINLLMRFYDAQSGGVFLDGRDVRCYAPDDLRRRFGAAFQNDMIFRNTLRENIDFGRGLSEDALARAVRDAMAEPFVSGLTGGLDYEAAIRGANLSGGQKQRILVARALAGQPDILLLDDASSALDYQTDAGMRKAVLQNHPDSTLIMIAQRVSSVMNMTQILVLDNGRCIGCGTHEELLKTCPAYRETYEIQMGAIA